jgi:hypothetical protein
MYPVARWLARNLSRQRELAEGGLEGRRMSQKFKVGDAVSWNSEAGRVRGTIIKVHTAKTDYKGHPRYATSDDPQYEIKSATTDHIAMHKGSALRKLKARKR